MKVFIGWSGELSHQIALAFRDWIKKVNQKVQAFVSSEDIQKGAEWFGDIQEQLEASDYGIICLTSENLNNPWIYFESGALSKKFGRKVCTLLIDINPSDIKPPISQFQHTILVKEDVKKLVMQVNLQLKDDAVEENILKESFEIWWISFEETVSKILKNRPQPHIKTQKRTQDELLEEILQIVRKIDRGQEPTVNPRANPFIAAILEQAAGSGTTPFAAKKSSLASVFDQLKGTNTTIDDQT